MSDEPIRFDAIVYKVQTTCDFGLRVTLDLPETAIVAAAQMMALKREGAILHVNVIPEKQKQQQIVTEEQENGKISTWAERKSSRAPS